jgi:hypothetical protein
LPNRFQHEPSGVGLSLTVGRRTAGGRIPTKETTMQDILWFGVMAGLLAATLAYVQLCDKA